MAKPTFRNANNGAWMNRELYTIRSVGSEQSTASGEVENGVERLLRVPSDGESAVIPNVAERSIDSFEEAEIFKYPIKGEPDLGSMFPSLNRSADTDSAEHSSWSDTTDSLSEDSLDEISVVKPQESVNPAESSEDCPGSTPPVSPSARGDTTGSSSTDSVSSSSQSRSTDTDRSSSRSHSTDSDRSSSQSNSTDSVSDSSGSHSTLYTSDASYTYLSDRAERKQKKRIAMENTPAGILALQRRPSVLTESDSSSMTMNLRLTLDNVEYVSSFDQASTNCDLSTLDEPISKEAATVIFFPMAIFPKEVPLDEQSDVSSICTRGKEIVTTEDFHDVEAGIATLPKPAPSTVSVQIKSIFQEYLGGRSKLELFFLLLICISGIALIVLLAVLVSQL